MIRKILAVIAGAALAVALITAIDRIGHWWYPAPGDLDFGNEEIVASYIASLPAGAFLIVLAGWGLGALCGGILAALIAREKPVLLATIIGALVALGTVMTLLSLPHPLWFSITAIVVIAVMTVLAGRIAKMLFARGG